MLIDRVGFGRSARRHCHRQAQLQRQRDYFAACSPLHRSVWGGVDPPGRLEELAELPVVDQEMHRRSQPARPPFGTIWRRRRSESRRRIASQARRGAVSLALLAAGAQATAVAVARRSQLGSDTISCSLSRRMTIRIWHLQPDSA